MPDEEIVVRCEYGQHGRYGSKDDPGVYFVQSKCKGCESTHYFMICLADYETYRYLTCNQCGKIQDPADFWKIIAVW